MKLTRRFRFATALLALASMLFMQLAVAAYACPPALAKATAVEGCDQAMAGAGIQDPAQPNLCQAHCNAADGSVDKPQLAQLPALAATDLVLVPFVLEHDQDAVAALVPALLLTRAIGPPLSIRNCCLRI